MPLLLAHKADDTTHFSSGPWSVTHPGVKERTQDECSCLRIGGCENPLCFCLVGQFWGGGKEVGAHSVRTQGNSMNEYISKSYLLGGKTRVRAEL